VNLQNAQCNNKDNNTVTPRPARFLQYIVENSEIYGEKISNAENLAHTRI